MGRLTHRKRYVMTKECIYRATFRGESVDIPLWRLKDFVSKMFDHSRHRNDLKNFFGRDNIFQYGTFSAHYEDGTSFVSYFKKGDFKGLGIIGDYKGPELISIPSPSMLSSSEHPQD